MADYAPLDLSAYRNAGVDLLGANQPPPLGEQCPRSRSTSRLRRPAGPGGGRGRPSSARRFGSHDPAVRACPDVVAPHAGADVDVVTDERYRIVLALGPNDEHGRTEVEEPARFDETALVQEPRNARQMLEAATAPQTFVFEKRHGIF